MKGRIRFVVITIVLIGLLALIELFYPKPVSWRVSLSSDSTIPFGVSALKESIDEVFGGNEIIMSRESFYLMTDSISNNFLSISEVFDQGKEDFEAMMQKIESGANVLIAAYHFSAFLQDSLNISVSDKIIKDLYPKGLISEKDSSFIRLKQPLLSEKFISRRMDAPYNFEIEDEELWTILATNEEEKPVALIRQIGKGKIILSCTPLIFSNYYLLFTNNSQQVAILLSQLPEERLHWTEFYSRGRGEVQTPLRYVLSTPSLSWAYYIAIFSIFAFIIIEARRKQRPIKIIDPPKNESLDFIKTVGNLYYEKGNHKNIAEKKIRYLLEHIRSHFQLTTTDLDNPEFYKQLAGKSGKPLLNIEGLFTMIRILQSKDSIHEEELRILNRKIEAFLKH